MRAPTFAAAVHLLCILSAVGRTGINPIPTADECCNDLIIKKLRYLFIYNSGFRPTSESTLCDTATLRCCDTARFNIVCVIRIINVLP